MLPTPKLTGKLGFSMTALRIFPQYLTTSSNPINNARKQLKILKKIGDKKVPSIDINQPIPTWTQLKKEKPSLRYALCATSEGLTIKNFNYTARAKIAQKTCRISLINLENSLSQKRKDVISCFVVDQYACSAQITAMLKLLVFLNNTDKEYSLKYCLSLLPENVSGKQLWRSFYQLVKEIELHIEVKNETIIFV